MDEIRIYTSHRLVYHHIRVAVISALSYVPDCKIYTKSVKQRLHALLYNHGETIIKAIIMSSCN